jgi:hypothetical protein
LLQQFKDAQSALAQPVIDQVQTAWIQYVKSKIISAPALQKALDGQDVDRLLVEEYARFRDILLQNQPQVAASVGEKFTMIMAAIEKSRVALENARQALRQNVSDKSAVEGFIDDVQDVLVTHLDKMVRHVAPDSNSVA